MMSVCPVELDDWWNRAIFVTGKYPILTLVVKACLSIFSMMNDIMNDKRSKMVTETYDRNHECKIAPACIGRKFDKNF